MKRFIAVLVVLGVAVSMSFAREYAKEGVIEFGGTASYLSQSGDMKYEGEKVGELKTTTMLLQPQVGYFVADNILLGAMVAYNQTTTESSGAEVTVTKTDIMLVPTYVFSAESGLYPYAALLVGTSALKNSTETSLTLYGIQAGVKVKVVEGGLTSIGLQYLMGTGKVKGSGTEVDLSGNQIVLSVGFSLYY